MVARSRFTTVKKVTLIGLALVLSLYCLFRGQLITNFSSFGSVMKLGERDVLREPGVPKVVHFVGYSDMTNVVWIKVQEKWKLHFPQPEYQIKFWDPNSQEAYDCFEKHFPMFLPIYKASKLNIVRADTLRYCVLYAEGGIYSDLDYEPLVNFFDELPPGKVSIVESPYTSNEIIQNSLMASPAFHPWWIKVMAEMSTRLTDGVRDANNIGLILQLTGPAVLTDLAYVPNWTRLQDPSIHPLRCERFQRSKYKGHSSTCGDVLPLSLDQAGIHWGTSAFMGGSSHIESIWAEAREIIDNSQGLPLASSIFL